MKLIRPLLVAVLALVLVDVAAAHVPRPVRAQMSLLEQERRLVVNLSHSRGAVAFLERRRAVASRSSAAVRELRFHRAAAGWQASRLDRVRLLRAAASAERDYSMAVRYVERAFGPQPFLWACPGSEGSFGVWVWNGGFPITRYPATIDGGGRPAGSSGAGGWLQFMHSTFESVIDDGIAVARARGLLVPSSARDWRSPLGQALAGLEMLRDGRRGEWSGSSC